MRRSWVSRGFRLEGLQSHQKSMRTRLTAWSAALRQTIGTDLYAVEQSDRRPRRQYHPSRVYEACRTRYGRRAETYFEGALYRGQQVRSRTWHYYRRHEIR